MKPFEEQFTAWVDGKLTGAELAEFEKQLAEHPEAAAEKVHGELDEAERERVRAISAATDNVGLFFGEDVFIALGAVLLIQGFLAENGLHFEPMQIALWALPTAIAAFAIHAIRIWLFQRRLLAELASAQETEHAAR